MSSAQPIKRIIMDLKNKANDVPELSNRPTPANGVIKKLRVSDEIQVLMQSQVQTNVSGLDNKAEGHHSTKTREIAWKNVGCGFWVRLTSTHNETNKAALVRDWVPLPQLKQHCCDWAHSRWGSCPGDATYRYTLQDTETTSLYCTLACKMGIPQHTAPQNNLDLWFHSKDPRPPNNDARLTVSCLSYIPYVLGETERFSIIISTPQQQILAWRYSQNQQVLMDLTFGFCSGHALLAILMVINEHNKGIPIAQLIFTAKKETKAVHMDYDKNLLDEQLGLWKKGMGKNKAGEAFTPLVANTDNDTRERYALQQHWEHILLLFCMFHIWQCWRNGLNKHLRMIPKGEHRQKIRSRLDRFLMRLLKDISKYEDALAAHNTELTYFKGLSNSTDATQKKQGQGGLAFLTYLQSYLKVHDFWHSWSVAGAMEAAKRMNVPLSRIARTTNHLESFNGRLKGKYFAPYLHSGRLPRIDFWIHILVTEALPAFFLEWVEQRELKEYMGFMRNVAPQRPLVIHKRRAPPNDIVGNHEKPETMKCTTPSQVVDAAKAWEKEMFSPSLMKRVLMRNNIDRDHEEALQILETSMIAELDDDGDSEDKEFELEVASGGGFGVETITEVPHLPVDVSTGEHMVAQDPDTMGMFASEDNMASIANSLRAQPASQDYNNLYSPKSTTSTLADIALNESAILNDLSIDIAFPFDLAQPLSSQDRFDFFHQEESVIALDCHISLSLCEQLFSEALQPFDIPKSPGH
ncbi:hypothetical protein BDZ94DRAFT_1342331 [Collybia nuda]|uniref:Transposase n=1 Tax=Collybia nuda TaxID=64659 RepID=A0A9P6CDP1_9AGAR|nr:hypothetical protein BDZ94DRAFT_1342331 [Collybia nuda]